MPAFVIFEAAGRRFAVPAAGVAQILRAAAPSPIPGAAPSTRGVLDVHGSLVQVIDVRLQLGVEVPRLRSSDQLIVLEDHGRRVALVVDRVTDVRDVADEDVEEAGEWTAGAELSGGALRLADGAVVVHSVDRWAALAAAAPAPRPDAATP